MRQKAVVTRFKVLCRQLLKSEQTLSHVSGCLSRISNPQHAEYNVLTAGPPCPPLPEAFGQQTPLEMPDCKPLFFMV